MLRDVTSPEYLHLYFGASKIKFISPGICITSRSKAVVLVMLFLVWPSGCSLRSALFSCFILFVVFMLLMMDIV